MMNTLYTSFAWVKGKQAVKDSVMPPAIKKKYELPNQALLCNQQVEMPNSTNMNMNMNMNNKKQRRK
mgnify:CR=1 FL=1